MDILVFVIFNIFILLLLALDLGVFNRKEHTINFKEAILLSAFWIVLSLIFNIGVYFLLGKQKALEFFTGYVLEKSLSMDNIFVFILIFRYFAVPSKYQHKVLFWGILGALIFRGIFIYAGVTLIEKFHWIIYAFGFLLLFSGGKLFFEKDKKISPDKNPVLKLLRRYFPISQSYSRSKFFIKEGKKLFLSPLLVVLVVIETTDIVFAVDSIPAILAITHDGFIVYSSNVFAILGLRALYFALNSIMESFQYLHY
jgi:tellurite resistance protein TerC